MKKAILYLHGKGGNACEVEQYAKNCPDFYLHGVDYQGSLPWLVQEQIVSDYRILRREYDSVILLANSMGVIENDYRRHPSADADAAGTL